MTPFGDPIRVIDAPLARLPCRLMVKVRDAPLSQMRDLRQGPLAAFVEHI